MADDPSQQVTRLLKEMGTGRTQAAEELLPLVYDELRRLARDRLGRERSGHEHQPTSLVHEAYLRLVGDAEYRWANRAHFFAAAAEAMRRIGVDRARRRASLKRGGDRRRVTLDDQQVTSRHESADVLALHEALERLEHNDPGMGNVVKLRYFAGLTIAETAQALDLSRRTVTRQWTAARAWLLDELSS